MDKREQNLIDLIASTSNPTTALEIALKLALELLESREEYPRKEPSFQAASV